ncbi:MAG: phytoene dehydrogenase [Bacteroidetes bacterium MED-G21]|nr:MAG: phytoene dehydrogenase [Bacteroidetes bacterium MED-G21]
MKNNRIIIVGSGIAGMAAAIRLQSIGYHVEIFEANSYAGGKLTAFKSNGYRFDMGPSLFTMPHLIEELFEIADKPIEDYFTYKRKSIICNYFFEDGTRFSAPSDKNAFAKSASNTFDVSEKTMLDYLFKSENKYELTASLFLENSLHKLSTYLSKDTIKALVRLPQLNINKNLSDYNSSIFKDPRLVQFYNRFATYNGSSPYKTPGIMSMIPHLEHSFGTYFPKGGMHQITKSLVQLAKDLGVKFTFNTKVEEIITKASKVTGIMTAKGFISSDIVISNADVVSSYRKLLRKQKAPERTLSQERSSSALIFYWGIKKTFPDLDLHNIFFSADYKNEFECIFKDQTISNDPTVYINISSKEESNDAPEGCENWFTMVNVPGNKGQDWDALIRQTRTNIIEKLNRVLKVDLNQLINYESIIDPRDIEKKTRSYQGSIYGAASHSKFSAFLRHPNFSSSIGNLFFCGGSVHPGGGIPLCLWSGKITADLIHKSSNS